MSGKKNIVPQGLIDAIDTQDPDRIRGQVADLPLHDRPAVLNAALGFAIAREHREAAKCLLLEGANPNLHDYRGDYPLHMAAELSTVAFVELLLKYGADPNVRSFSRSTALHNAASAGAVSVVKKLLAAGAEPDVASSTGATPLMLACQNGHKSIADALIRAGANVNAASKFKFAPGDTVLHHAASGGNVDCVSLLLEHGANPLARGNHGLLPIQVAAKSGFPKIVELLTESAGDAGRVTSKELEEAKTLEESRKKAEEMDPRTRHLVERALTGSVLHDAALLGDEEKVRALLAGGCGANDRDRYGFCALHKAAQFGRLGVIKVLAEAGANVNEVATTRAGARPLHYAAGYGQPDAVSLLLELGADPSGTDGAGKPPIDWATSSRSYADHREANERSAEILRRSVMTSKDAAVKPSTSQ
jgi:ankyrin repeat protein